MLRLETPSLWIACRVCRPLHHCYCFSNFLAKSLTLPPAGEGRCKPPSARCAEDPQGVTPECFGDLLPGGRTGRFGGPLIFSCVVFDELLLGGEDSLLDCVFLLTDVKSFLLGGIRTFLTFDVGDGVVEGAAGGGRAGAGLRDFCSSGMGVPCPLSSERPSLVVAIFCSVDLHV